ncbi:CaiB/BaiF CoA transferase family protein [Nocardioides sp. NPDC059952]|uniref:CaiB/BaiF CoA transferase family protein n=1 Tax=Nocardioides sp. NPDC059952 TaxID=3347014 RepID=UPI0036532D2D
MQPEDLPLAGTVVLDFSQFLAGPVAALRLADLGARVIKVERPRTGEIGRTLAFAGRSAAGDTLSFHAMNRNKEAVVADLKDPDDLDRVKDLVARADVLIENFRPGVMERIGLDYESVRELNPALVYASASGYGDTGPWASRPGQDLLAQAVSGATWLAGADRPMTIGLSLADHLMSCHLAEGVTALLVRRARTGRGGLVETSLLEGMLDLQATLLTRREGEDMAASPRPTSAWTAAGVFASKDGYVALSGAPLDELATMLDDAELARLAATGGEEDEPPNQVSDLIAAALGRDTTAAWLDALDAKNGSSGWLAPVRTLEELLASPEFAALEMTQEVERSAPEPGGTPVTLTTTRSPIRVDGEILRHRRGAPRLGEHGILREGADPLGGDPHGR